MGYKFAKWFIDESFATHEDFRSHTGGVLKLSDSRGGFIKTSIWQKLNTRPGIETDLVGVNDCIGKVIWTATFLKMQDSAPTRNILMQDNRSAMLLETKGNSSAGKRMRHLDVHYYFVQDLVSKGMVSVEHCGSQNMIGDFHTKALQGTSFQKFCAAVLGCQ